MPFLSWMLCILFLPSSSALCVFGHPTSTLASPLRTLHFPVLNLTMFLSAYFCSLSGPSKWWHQHLAYHLLHPILCHLHPPDPPHLQGKPKPGSSLESHSQLCHGEQPDSSIPVSLLLRLFPSSSPSAEMHGGVCSPEGHVPGPPGT